MSTEIGLTWQKIKILGVFFANIAVPLVIAFVGYSYSEDQKRKELSIRYVELAVGILSSPVPKEGNRGLREWAVKTIDLYSEVPISESVKEELISQRLDFESLKILYMDRLIEEKNRLKSALENMGEDGQKIY